MKSSVRSFFSLFVCLTVALSLAGCSGQTSSHEGEVQVETASAPQEPAIEIPAKHVDKREVVCWGDSLTYGFGASEAHIKVNDFTYDASYKSYPQILAEFTGLKTFNFGVVGATSKEVNAMQGGLVVHNQDSFQDSRVGEVVTQARSHPGNILIIEMGSNGGWETYDELIAQYREMLTRAHCENYIILGDTDDPGTSIADINQPPFEFGTGSGETAWEAALHAAFGNHFLNMRAFLVNRGLAVTGLVPTPEDEMAASVGCISQQLRSDWTHLNSYGYYAQALAIYECGQALGYWH